MQNLEALYKFTYLKKQELPDVHYIRKREDELYFFYQLEGSNYISLEILLKSYLSQIIRLSIGQCLILIQSIYEKVIEVYRKEGKQLPKITLQNIWIYTEKGFSGEIKPQKSMKIIFLNYQDENLNIEENLKQLQLINKQIRKYCLKTEFKIRATDGKNSLLIQQILDIIDDMFYNIEMCLYQNTKDIKKIIKEYINDETQETDYEYLQKDVEYIQKNFENVIKKLNEIFKQDCQNELQLHKKLLNWQNELFNYFIETNWDTKGQELIMKMIDFFEQKIQENIYMTSEIEHKMFRKLEEQGFLNFNSQIIRLSSEVKFRRELESSLDLEMNKCKSKKEDGDIKNKTIDQIYQDRLQKEKENAVNNAEFTRQQNIRDQNLNLIKNFYKQNAQNRYKLYDRFYYTINLKDKWTEQIKKEILPKGNDRDIIKLEDQELEKTLTPFFENLLKLNKIGRNNEEEKPKYI